MPAQHIMLALTNPVPNREDEYNAWYSDVHVPHVLSAPGWVAAQRFRATEEQRPGQSPPWRYLALYEIDRPVGEIYSALEHRSDPGPRGTPDPPLWTEDSGVWTYTALGPRVTSE